MSVEFILYVASRSAIYPYYTSFVKFSGENVAGSNITIYKV